MADLAEDRFVEQRHRHQVSFLTKAANFFEWHLENINWIHVAFKTTAFTYIAFVAWIAWQIFPVPSHWQINTGSDKSAASASDLATYFNAFEGHAECKIDATDLYLPPISHGVNIYIPRNICHTRESLLNAMSQGGRIGFDAPYVPQSCYFKWYAVANICMILERFDALVFIGDDAIQTVYNGFNILLRQDLASGALQDWKMSFDDKKNCICEHQFNKASCAQHFVTSSHQYQKGSLASVTENACHRVPHMFIQTKAAQPAPDTIEQFKRMVPVAPRSNYKSVPIIYSVSPMTSSHTDATASLLSFRALADSTSRKTPMLWIGPTAPGHIEVRGRKSNQQVWDFDQEMARAAKNQGIEVLKFWNMTVQASSWDGIHFGESTAIIQAMMVINWLSRLESN